MSSPVMAAILAAQRQQQQQQQQLQQQQQQRAGARRPRTDSAHTAAANGKAGAGAGGGAGGVGGGTRIIASKVRQMSGETSSWLVLLCSYYCSAGERRVDPFFVSSFQKLLWRLPPCLPASLRTLEVFFWGGGGCLLHTYFRRTHMCGFISLIGSNNIRRSSTGIACVGASKAALSLNF